jgi:hypothetical protein
MRDVRTAGVLPVYLLIGGKRRVFRAAAMTETRRRVHGARANAGRLSDGGATLALLPGKQRIGPSV